MSFVSSLSITDRAVYVLCDRLMGCDAGAAQRVEWFRRGFEGGEMKQCDTFVAVTWKARLDS
ncbi:MAG: neutral zinc metallopeptidase [Haliea sp.]|jgi:hypothetical protein|nr:neutral zinc metallopeptidase [Haliea sp.]MDP4918786.1 neutral zinc metallopeptidase [Haliea sp.]